MSQLARLGFILLGLSVAFESLASAGAQIVDLQRFEGSPRLLVLALGLLLVFGFLPGAILCVRARTFAEALFPGSEAGPELKTSSVITAATVVLGAYFIVTGLSVLVGSSIAFAYVSFEAPNYAGTWAGQAVTGALQLAIGAVAVFKAPAITRFLFRGSEKAAA